MIQRYLLSIDSGGIRGIIPLYALMKLEETRKQRTRDALEHLPYEFRVLSK